MYLYFVSGKSKKFAAKKNPLLILHEDDHEVFFKNKAVLNKKQVGKFGDLYEDAFFNKTDVSSLAQELQKIIEETSSDKIKTISKSILDSVNEVISERNNLFIFCD